MSYQGDLLIINGINCKGLIKDYKVTYSKLWKDADRNMAGRISANLIGIFTKITATTKTGLTQAESARLTKALNQAYFSTTYYDPETNARKTETFYAADFDVSMLDKARGLDQPITLTIIATDKR